MNKILVTGGAGFIGSNFINYALDNYKDVFIVNLDKLTYAGNLENLIGVEDSKNYQFIKGDITNSDLVANILNKYQIDYIVNFAAESHVDRSIVSPFNFYHTNVLGTNILLNAARDFGIKKFVQISTDEVYGSLENGGLFSEISPLKPMNPYSSSKAGADLMALAFHNTYGMPIVITRCSNNYGPYQFPEKLIPRMCINACLGIELPVHGDGTDIRDWIYVDDHNKAIMKVLEDGEPGEIYNIGSSNEKTNIEIVKLILDYLGKPYSLIKFCPDRPGHDRRYGIDSSKIQKELNWRPDHDFDETIIRTIQWYQKNKRWWQHLDHHKQSVFASNGVLEDVKL